MSRSASQASTATTTTTATARTLSTKPATSSTNSNSSSIANNPLPPSHIRLFVTNLRLLDLDLLDDWPAITVQTFATRHAEENQKRRIEAVEWALFRLFELWDPRETREKLQAFFPPLEPLQSLNLRAALFRCLNELKKTGVLGRESVLRKTMLDECKGDKFYEILVLFSNAVLKKVIAARTQDSEAIPVARKLATATRLSHGEQSSLLPLAIAHKASLRNVLKRKEEERRKYMEFSALLDGKKEAIDCRILKCTNIRGGRKSLVSETESYRLKKQLKDNWIGNTKWLDTMMYGDEQGEDGFLTRSFPEVWRAVEKGRRLEDAGGEPGLLESLEKRVEEQKSRLQRWKSFHEKMIKEKPLSAPQSKNVGSPSNEATKFNFDEHLQLQLGRGHPKQNAPLEKKLKNPEYQQIISEMEEELERVAKEKHNRPTIPRTHRRGSSLSGSRPSIHRRISQTATHSNPPPSRSMSHSGPPPTSHPVEHAAQLSASHSAAQPEPPSKITVDHFACEKEPKYVMEKDMKHVMPSAPKLRTEDIPLLKHRPSVTITPVDSEATLVGQPTSRDSMGESHNSPTTGDGATDTYNILSVSDSGFSPEPIPVHERPPTSPSAYFPSEPPVLPSESSPLPAETPAPPVIYEPPVLSHEEQLAEQIIGSIGEATPSPIKKQPRLSLAERTRMSMAHTSAFAPIEESPPDTNPLPSLPTFAPPPEAHRRTSLLERTRLSMAAMMENPRPQPTTAKKDRRKSSRQSLYPVNQFETPRTLKMIKSVEELREKIETTPKEELFSDDVEEEKVFKSRPKIALSPIFSPNGVGDGSVAGSGSGGDAGLFEDLSDLDEGVTGLDLDDVDQDGYTESWADSPSRRRG